MASTYIKLPIVTASGGSGVTSFNTRTGAVTLEDTDVVAALGFTPANDTLSNLDAPTSINQSLIPAADQTYSIGSPSFNWNDIQAVELSCNGDAARISLLNKTIYDGSGNINYEWVDRKFYDSATGKSIDYEQRELSDSASSVVISWELYRINDSAGNRSIMFNDRNLTDSAQTTSVDWDTRHLRDDSGVDSVDWLERQLVGVDGNIGLDYSSSTNISVTENLTMGGELYTAVQASAVSAPAAGYLVYYTSNIGYPTWKDPSNRSFAFSLNLLSAGTPRELIVPDADGTIALQSYVTSGFLPISNPTATGTLTVPTIRGGTSASGTLTLQSTSNATKGKILFGTSAYDEVNNRLGIGQATPTSAFHALINSIGVTYNVANGIHLENSTAASSGNPQYSPVLTLSGNGFQGAASGLSRWSIDVVTTSGSSYGSNLRFQSNTNGSLATPFQLSQNGSLTISNAMSAFSYSASSSYTAGSLASSGTSGTTNLFTTTNSVAPTSGTLVWNGVNIAPTINQTGGANGITRGVYINPTLTAAADFRAIETTAGKVVFAATNTGAGTTGDRTINKTSGTVNFAAAATALVVTNSLVTTASIVFAVVRTNDATATIKNVVPAAGSFTINLGAAATAETSVGFMVIN